MCIKSSPEGGGEGGGAGCRWHNIGTNWILNY